MPDTANAIQHLLRAGIWKPGRWRPDAYRQPEAGASPRRMAARWLPSACTCADFSAARLARAASARASCWAVCQYRSAEGARPALSAMAPATTSKPALVTITTGWKHFSNGCPKAFHRLTAVKLARSTNDADYARRREIAAAPSKSTPRPSDHVLFSVGTAVAVVAPGVTTAEPNPSRYA